MSKNMNFSNEMAYTNNLLSNEKAKEIFFYDSNSIIMH